MATKTWKIGEYAKGGIITVETNKTTITVIGKEWDFAKGSRRSSDQSNAKEWTRLPIPITDPNAYRLLHDILNDITTSYYAGQILDWIKSKTTLNTLVGGIYW